MSLKIYKVSELRAATDDFSDSKFIGGGGCGRVFRGTLASGDIIAVKRWTGGTSQQHSLMELMNELNTLATIAHENLLPVLGFACQPPDDLMLVMPHLSRGSLHDALHGANAVRSVAAAGLSAASWRVSFLLGLARGIQALHAAHVVHRDVKSANVLIGDNGRAVLADAGVARELRADADATGTRVIGTDGYLDPEYLDTMALTYKSDVFSIGVVILEMLTGKPARDSRARPPLLWRRFRSTRYGDLDERVRQVLTGAAACWGGRSVAGPAIALASLALQATARMSADRPSVEVVIATLEDIHHEAGGGDESVRMCMVCLTEPRETRFDCGHMTTCGDCIARWPECLVCNDFTGLDLNLDANPRDPTYVAPDRGDSGSSEVGNATYTTAGRVSDDVVSPEVELPMCAPLAAEILDSTLPAPLNALDRVSTHAEPSSMSDEDILSIWCEECPELRKLWPADKDVSTWEGVTLGRTSGSDSARRVVKIELAKMLGVGAVEVPAAVGGLDALTTLHIFGNKTTSVPAEIGALGSLTKLFLGMNQLSSLPVEIGALTSLTFLYLNGNSLTNLPAELGMLSSLEFLYLDSNRLTHIPAEMGSLHSLKELYLGGNRLTNLPAQLGALRSLTELYLDCNLLTSVPPELGRLSSLKELNLDRNQLGSLPAELWRLCSLTELNVGGNNLTNVPPEFGRLSSLKALYLNGNRLADVPAELGVLSSLTELNLSDNRLTKVPRELGTLVSLTELYLDKNHLTDLPMELGRLGESGVYLRVDEGVTMEAGASSSAFTHMDRRSAHEPLCDISEGS